MTREEQAKEVWHKAFENLVDDMKGLTREQLASGFFELGWRAADENPPKGTSLIKWQTGEPKEEGAYLVTIKVREDVVVTYNRYSYSDGWHYSNKVLAWCKLSDVEPYKEE